MVDNNHSKGKEDHQQSSELNNNDVVDDNNEEVQQGGGGKIKNITVGAAAAALNVAKAAKQHTASFGSDVLSDVNDASNFVLPQNRQRDSNNTIIPNPSN